MKKYKTILKLSNPNGAVMVNEDYEPEGNLRRYERRTLFGSILIVDHDLKSARENYKKVSRSPNIEIETIRYELVGDDWEKVKTKQ